MTVQEVSAALTAAVAEHQINVTAARSTLSSEYSEIANRALITALGDKFVRIFGGRGGQPFQIQDLTVPAEPLA